LNEAVDAGQRPSYGEHQRADLLAARRRSFRGATPHPASYHRTTHLGIPGSDPRRPARKSRSALVPASLGESECHHETNWGDRAARRRNPVARALRTLRPKIKPSGKLYRCRR